MRVNNIESVDHLFVYHSCLLECISSEHPDMNLLIINDYAKNILDLYDVVSPPKPSSSVTRQILIPLDLSFLSYNLRQISTFFFLEGKNIYY